MVSVSVREQVSCTPPPLDWFPGFGLGGGGNTVNQHPPVQPTVRDGWMISGKETVFCWISVP